MMAKTEEPSAIIEVAADITETALEVADMNFEKFSHYIEVLGDMGLKFAMSFLMAILVYSIGQWINRRIVNLLDIAMTKKRVEVTLHKFLVSIFKILFF